MPRRIRLPIALCALALSAGPAVAGASAVASPVAHAARGCGSSSSGSLRGGYYLGLNVKGTGCATGRRVQAGWQSCRLKHGLAGRCTARVAGFSCHEQRQSISIQITARVSCRRAGKTVGWTYQQNLA